MAGISEEPGFCTIHRIIRDQELEPLVSGCQHVVFSLSHASINIGKEQNNMRRYFYQGTIYMYTYIHTFRTRFENNMLLFGGKNPDTPDTYRA